MQATQLILMFFPHFLIGDLCRLFAGAKMVDRCHLHGSSLCYLRGNLKNSLLSFSLQSFTSNANFSVIRVILQLNGTLGGQLVVPYDFPLVVLQTISMIFSTCDGAWMEDSVWIGWRATYFVRFIKGQTLSIITFWRANWVWPSMDRCRMCIAQTST